ncbi:MAG: polyprenyl synthetase family protein [Propionibacteriales bacterium]|nr:polyprenyl synthetase family protein [Propionibacteriales bacterium]
MTDARGELPPVNADLEARVRAGLAEVERRLQASVDSDAPLVADVSRHLMNAGGKRFRPMLVLTAAEFGDPEARGVLDAAVGVELTHLASLYHDDVMDEADLRRGAKSANALWDNSMAILTGDFLFAQASQVIADLGAEAVRIQAQTFARLVEGQIRETAGPREGDELLDHYLRVVADKTGSLIATSARYGAMMSGSDADLVPVLTEFGERIGTAFQLSDDVIDIASDSDELGKSAGTDLREGVPTLPVLIARRSTDPADARLLELLTGPLTDDSLHAETLGLLRVHPAMNEARAEVERRAEQARELLAKLPDVPARDALADMCDLVVHRTT